MYAKTLFAAACAVLAMQSASADDKLIDSVYGEYAAGQKIQMARIGATSDWSKQWFQSNGNSLSGYWDASFGAWRGNKAHNIEGEHQTLVDIGFTPVFRYQADNKKGWFVEGGIGIHVLSKLYDNNGDKLATAFEFGDHIGVGYVFNNKWEVSAKIQHFSNGGIKEPNSGVNYGVVKAAYHF